MLPQSPAENEIETQVAAIARALLARRQWLAVAESCTGGLIAQRLTDLAGSSGWFERGIVSYSDRAKRELLDVPATVLERHGAVSGETAAAMASGLLARAPVDWTLAVTGIAGPGGGSADKPVGLVYLAWARRGGTVELRRCEFRGDRAQIRNQTAQAALAGLRERLQGG